MNNNEFQIIELEEKENKEEQEEKEEQEKNKHEKEPQKKTTQSKQHYPPGTQEDYNSFSSRNLIMGKGKDLEFPEGWGGGKGEPGVPPIFKVVKY